MGAPEPVVDVASRLPAPALRPFVEGYTGYRVAGFAPGIHRGLPGRHLTYIISLGDPVEIASMPDPRHPAASYGAFVSGLHAGPARIAHDGTQHGIALDLTPLGCRALLGMPASELAGLVVGLDDVLGRRATHLVDRLVAADGWDARFDVLDAELGALAAARDAPTTRPEVAAVWTRLVRSGGALEVGALAADLGWSRRHLGARFRDEIGLAPKAFARIVRFERAKQLLQQPDRPALADVAAAAGFFDQAHLNRDWRDLAGCSPSQWLAEELPSVQAVEAAPVAG